MLLTSALTVCLVSGILRRAKTPASNFDRNVFKALIALKKDPNRVVLSADNANCVVVMDKHQYCEKVLLILNDKQTYTTLKFDPTGRTKSDLNQWLIFLKKSSKISEETYKLLCSSDGLAPRLYGSPKTHKEGVFATYSVLDELSNL